MPQNVEHAAACQHQGQPLKRPNLLAVQPHREANGEKNLCLYHQRRDTGRNVAIYGEVEQAELADANQQPVERQIAQLDRRAAQKEHRRDQRQGKTHRREQQRRQIGQGVFDNDEIRPPNADHGQCEEKVGERERSLHLPFDQ